MTAYHKLFSISYNIKYFYDFIIDYYETAYLDKAMDLYIVYTEFTIIMEVIDRKKDTMREEWKGVLHSTWLKIVLVAIITIPMLYAGIFLGSMWDPYGKAEDIPVAVVNKDQQVTYNDTTLDVGNELVKNLKENKSMKFSFMDETQAMNGLKDGTYYMVITIPSDFSKNATTLLDEHPKKMKLEYTTNPGTNYIATKMDDTAMSKIKESVSASVTETYADTIFSQVKTMSSGLKDGSDGSAKLYDGVNTAQDGSKQINDNLKVLANSTLSFEDGTSTLVKGLSDYTNGVDTLQKGSLQLQNGLSQLNGNTPALADGIAKLTQGSSDLQNGITTYTGGVNQLSNSSALLAQNNPTLLSGIKQVATGSTALYQGSQNITNGLKTMSNQIGENMEKSQADIQKLMQGNQAGVSSMEDLKVQAQQLEAALSSASESQKTAIETLRTVQTSDPVSYAKLNAVIQGMEASNENYEKLSQVLKTLSNQSDQMKTVLNGDSQAITTLSQSIQDIKTALDAQGTSANDMGLIQGMETLEKNLSVLDQSLNSDQGLVKGVEAYTNGVSALSQGASQIQENSEALCNGASQLAQGSQAINANVPALTQGINDLEKGSKALTQGANTLVSNNPKILNGAQALQSGSTQLHDGANQLAAGSDSLYSGLSTIKSGTSTLQTSLMDGANKSQLDITHQTKEMMASPVTLQHQEISTVENNGHAMAPYMMSVGLYVACMAFTLMYPLLKNNIHTTSGFKLWASKAGVMYVISTVMAIVMIGALMLVNGLSPYQVAGTFGMAILVAAAFMSMIVFFSITCGKIGSFIVLIFMVLQLGGAAGTYPIETSGVFYNVIHPFMPFTYSVEAFRHTLAMGGNITTDILVFVGMIVVFSVLSILFYRWKANISDEAYEKTALAKFH